MKVPQYIKNEMHSVCDFAAKADAHMKKIETWLELNGINPDDLRTGDGSGLEDLEYGVDVTDLICEKLEDWNGV